MDAKKQSDIERLINGIERKMKTQQELLNQLRVSAQVQVLAAQGIKLSRPETKEEQSERWNK